MYKVIEGVILTYYGKRNKGKGLVLLQHNKKKSLEELIRKYMSGVKTKDYRFAKFLWSSIDDLDKGYVLGRFARSERHRFKMTNFLRGRFVFCHFKRSNIIRIKFNFKKPKVELCVQQRNYNRVKTPNNVKIVAKPSTSSRAIAREYAKNLTRKDNIAHPWRG